MTTALIDTSGLERRDLSTRDRPPERKDHKQPSPPMEHPPDSLLAAFVDTLVALGRSRAAADAMEAALFADLVSLVQAAGVSSEAELGLRSLAAEVGAALRISDRVIQRRMSEAHELVRGFPDVHHALSAGEITASHARMIVDAGLPISPGAARDEFAQRALALARAESPNRLRGMLPRVAERVQEISITERHRLARRGRAVWVTDDADGMSTLHAHLPSVLAHGVKDRLDQMAHALRDVALRARAGASEAGAGTVDERTVDQLRADLLADLLLAATPSSADSGVGAIRAQVAITVPALTLCGRTESGAELDGVSPIDADAARRLAGDAAGWDRLLTDPVSGVVVATDRYRPTAEMRRALLHRDQHCRHPGCRLPARYADVDHNQEWAHGGQTKADNLSFLCRRHHSLKTSTAWRITQHAGGVLEFHTPLGRSYIDAPQPRAVSFASVEGPEVIGHRSSRANNEHEPVPASVTAASSVGELAAHLGPAPW